MAVQGFPRELLEQPVSVRIHYFATKIVAHRRLKEAYDDLIHTIQHPAGTSLILAYGPTGVGKTTLRLRAEKQIAADAAANPYADPGQVAYAGIDAAAVGGRYFEWKDYCFSGLKALDEPFLKDKVTYELHGIHRDEQGRLVIERKQVSTTDMWRVLLKTMIHRHPYAFFLDEAQHLKRVASGQRLLEQMDALKSFATMSKTLHVLLGNYELLGLRNQSGQLSRRTKEIHLPRYYANNEEDLQEFIKVLLTFQRHLPLPEEPDLVSHYAYFYDQCLGCIGILKDLLSRCLAAALEQEEPILTADIWEKQAPTPGQMASIIEEILTGEEAFAKEEETLRKLRQQLKFPTINAVPEQPTSSPQTDQSPQPTLPTEPPESSQKRRRRVGEQNPRRIRVGKGKEHVK